MVLPTAESPVPAGQATAAALEHALAGVPGVIGTGGDGAMLIDFKHAVHGQFTLTLALIAIATFILMIAMAPYQALLPRLVRQHFDRGVGSYGLLFSLMAVGMVAGSLAYARWNPRRNRVILCYAAFGINDIGMVIVAVTPWFPLALAAVVWRGFFVGFAIALWTTLLTELVPTHFLSRVVSLDFFGSLGLTPIGYALVGAVAGLFTPAQIIAFGGAAGFVLWFVPLLFRDVRAAA